MKHEDFEMGDVVPNSKLKPGNFYFVDGLELCVLDKLEYCRTIHCTFITERGEEINVAGGENHVHKAIQKETAPQARETVGGMYIEYESLEAKYDHMINRNAD